VSRLQPADAGRPFVIGVVSSDWHITTEPPLFRGKEPDWYAAMQRPIDRIKELMAQYNCPLFFAGDLFDKWNSSAELINWALKHLPVMYGVPGQHDLPYHDYAAIHKSAYWTMVEANRVINIAPGHCHPVADGLMVYGFPWGSEVVPVKPNDWGHNLALVHAYCWTKKASYPGAPPDKKASEWLRKTNGFRWACFGDNHKPFTLVGENTSLINCGSLMRRKSDERAHAPAVYLLWSDGEFTIKKLDTSKDVLLDEDAAVEEVGAGVQGLVDLAEVLGKLKASKIDFVAVIKESMDKLGLTKGVREKVLQACEGK
jgi:DNA repair exonuclease SbcCD nuclease subunit